MLKISRYSLIFLFVVLLSQTIAKSEWIPSQSFPLNAYSWYDIKSCNDSTYLLSGFFQDFTDNSEANARVGLIFYKKNDNGLWHKQMFFPIKNFLTKDVYTFNIDKNLWEKQIAKKDITINPIFQINQDGTKVISYDLGHKWFKVTAKDDYMSDNIIAYFNQNEETITYQINNIDLRNINEISLFDINGKELFKTVEIQPLGSINVANIATNVILINFKLNNTNITKKVIIY